MQLASLARAEVFARIVMGNAERQTQMHPYADAPDVDTLACFTSSLTSYCSRRSGVIGGIV
jgi:hypothetical protein